MITSAAAGEAALQQARNTLGVDAVWVVGETAVDLPAARQRLHDAGHAALLCEGGPTLFGCLLDEGLVDELFLTISPRLFGRQLDDQRKPLVDGVDLAGRPLDLLGLRRHESHLFLRYATRGRSR